MKAFFLMIVLVLSAACTKDPLMDKEVEQRQDEAFKVHLSTLNAQDIRSISKAMEFFTGSLANLEQKLVDEGSISVSEKLEKKVLN